MTETSGGDRLTQNLTPAPSQLAQYRWETTVLDEKYLSRSYIKIINVCINRVITSFPLNNMSRSVNFNLK